MTKLNISQVRETLGENFSHLSDEEIEQIRDEMYNFWEIMLEK